MLQFDLDPRLEFTDAALRVLASARKADRRFLLDGIKKHLLENDPAQVTKNKFPLRRPSPHAERELRLDHWRVFYSVNPDDGSVLVRLIGVKQGSKLYIGGEEWEL